LSDKHGLVDIFDFHNAVFGLKIGETQTLTEFDETFKDNKKSSLKETCAKQELQIN